MKPARPAAASQLGFGFDEPVQAQPAPAKPKPEALTQPAPAVTPVVAPVVAPDNSAEAMARTLEAHPDYRVLRRLVPQLEFAPASGPVLTLLVLDTETTGLNPARDKVVELALLRVTVDLATGQPVGAVQVYDGLEDPGMPMPEEITVITGITDDMLRGQSLDEARVLALLDGADLVLAHNAGFDRPFVEARLPQFAALTWACSFADIDWKQAGRGSAKLTSLASELGLFYDAHRAEMDCHALLAVLMAPLAGTASSGLMRLIEASRSPTFRLQATNAPFGRMCCTWPNCCKRPAARSRASRP